MNDKEKAELFSPGSPIQKYQSTKSNNFLTSFKRRTNHNLTGNIFKNKQLNQLFAKSTKKLGTTKPALQRASIVYQLPNTGDMKSKDYDKISGDIKKLEVAIRKEHELNWRKLSSKNLESNNFNSIESYSSDANNTIDEELEKNNNNKNAYKEHFNILEVIQKFKISPENRTVEDLYVTKNFLYQTKLLEHYRKEFNNDKKMIENLTTFFGLEFRYQKFKEGESIYKIDDYADNFYMVLLGKIEIFKVEPKLVNITGYEYFCYIMNLKKNNEMHRYKLTIEENRDIFPIWSDEEDLLPYFFLQFVLEDIKEGKSVNFSKILEIINMSPKDLGLVETKIIFNDYILEKEKRILRKIINLSKDKINEYRFINNKIVKRNLKLYEYVKYKTIDSLNFFGEDCIESSSPRTETAICAETTELIYLMNKLYINNILPKKAIILERKTAFLAKNYLFNKITPKKFVRRYFNLFSLETYNKGDILFSENANLDYVYFIKEGNVNLLTSKSILEMEMFINEINKKIKVVQNIFNNEGNDEEENNFNFLYNNIKSSSAELFDYIKKKEKINIFVLKESEDAGLVSYLLGIGYLVTGIVDSPTALIYKIKKEDLTEILRKEKLCFYELINRVEDKLKILSKRFYEINNIKLSMTDHKIAEENNIKYNISSKNQNYDDINTDIFPTLETKADVEKLKELINIHNTNKLLNNHKISKGRNLSLVLPNLFNKLINKRSSNLNLSPKKSKEFNLAKNIQTILNTYSNTSNNSKNKKKKIKSFFPPEKTKNKLTLKQRVKKLIYYKKKFPYEEEFLMKLTQDMNDLVENKLILTKKITKTEQNELLTTKTENNILNNTGFDDTNEKNNLLLITQVDNFKNKINANHIFTQTDHDFNPKKNNNNDNDKNNLEEKNLNNEKNDLELDTILISKGNKKNSLENNKTIRLSTINNISTDNNILNNEKINKSKLIKNNNQIRNIKHPYVSPLTMVKLKRYKMIDDKDKFEENKKRYEKNIIKKNKERGLNQFGFPITYDITLTRKYNQNYKYNNNFNLFN